MMLHLWRERSSLPYFRDLEIQAGIDIAHFVMQTWIELFRAR